MFSNSRSRLLAAFAAIFAVVASVTALAAPSQAVVGGSIAVLVQDETNTRLADIDVSLYKKQGGHWVHWDVEATKSTGRYKFTGLDAGAYRLCANEYRSSPHYYQRCWQTGDDVETGRTMHLADGQAITARRITLTEGGTISGALGSEAARRGENVKIAVLDMSGTIIEAIRATIGSQYTVGPLPTGSYRVQFDRGSMPTRYIGQFFDGLPETDGLGAASAVSVTTGADTPDIDATMTTGGTISGFTKTTTGDPVEGCTVVALADDGVRSTRLAWASSTGRFVITGLSPGSYKVAVLNCVNVEKWYDHSKAKNVSTVKGDADLVTVTEGGATGIGTLKVTQVNAS